MRGGLELEPLIHGACHELGQRAGTESALLAVGLGTACVLAADLAPMEHILALRDRFWLALQDRFDERVMLNGHATNRLPNTLNMSFVGKVGSEVGDDVAVPRELMLQFVVDTFLTALTWCLEKKPKLAPSQINDMFRHLVTRGIGRAIVTNSR